MWGPPGGQQAGGLWLVAEPSRQAFLAKAQQWWPTQHSSGCPQPLARSHTLSRRRLPTRSGVPAAVCWKATNLLGEGAFTLAHGYDQAVARDSRDSSGRLRFLAFRDAAELLAGCAARASACRQARGHGVCLRPPSGGLGVDVILLWGGLQNAPGNGWTQGANRGHFHVVQQSLRMLNICLCIRYRSSWLPGFGMALPKADMALGCVACLTCKLSTRWRKGWPRPSEFGGVQLLKLVVPSATWPDGRVCELIRASETDGSCALCGATVCDETHVAWGSM